MNEAAMNSKNTLTGDAMGSIRILGETSNTAFDVRTDVALPALRMLLGFSLEVLGRYFNSKLIAYETSLRGSK